MSGLDQILVAATFVWEFVKAVPWGFIIVAYFLWKGVTLIEANIVKRRSEIDIRLDQIIADLAGINESLIHASNSLDRLVDILEEPGKPRSGLEDMFR